MSTAHSPNTVFHPVLLAFLPCGYRIRVGAGGTVANDRVRSLAA